IDFCSPPRAPSAAASLSSRVQSSPRAQTWLQDRSSRAASCERSPRTASVSSDRSRSTTRSTAAPARAGAGAASARSIVNRSGSGAAAPADARGGTVAPAPAPAPEPAAPASSAGGGAAGSSPAPTDRASGNPGPASGVPPEAWALAAPLARASAFSLSSWPAWPLTHSKVTDLPAIAASSAFITPTLSTGLPSAFFQPLRFQPGIHLVIELITYWESQSTWSGSGECAVWRSRSRTAVSSPWLLVPRDQPPQRHCASSMYQAQPAGPGLPRADPSAAAMIVTRDDPATRGRPLG